MLFVHLLGNSRTWTTATVITLLQSTEACDIDRCSTLELSFPPAQELETLRVGLGLMIQPSAWFIPVQYILGKESEGQGGRARRSCSVFVKTEKLARWG